MYLEPNGRGIYSTYPALKNELVSETTSFLLLATLVPNPTPTRCPTTNTN